VVCDYIAGMTDRFAIEEHRKLFHTDLWDRM
jgi:dGTPase